MLQGLQDWFKKLSPEAQKALIAGGFSAAGSFIESRGAAGENQENREFQGEQSEAQRQFQREENQASRQFQLGGALAGMEQAFLGQDRQGASDVMGQTRMGEIPSTYGNLAMRRALFESLAPGTTFGNVGGLQAPEQFRDDMPTLGGPSLDGARAQAMKYFSDDALQADLTRRLSAEARVDPNGATFDMTSMFGPGAAGSMGQIQGVKDRTNSFITGAQDKTRAALQSALGNPVPGSLSGGTDGRRMTGSGVPTGSHPVQQTMARKTGESKGTPWWKKALGIGLGAAGLIAAPFTGGVSTALIGAGGALAGSKLMGGSNKDALMAALGGATSGLGRGGTRPTPGGLVQVGRVPRVTFGGR